MRAMSEKVGIGLSLKEYPESLKAHYYWSLLLFIWRWSLRTLGSSMFVRSCRISLLFLRVLGFIGALLISFIFFGRLLFIDTFHFILKLTLGSSSFV